MNFLRLPPVIQTFLLAWACSSWTKATLLLPYRRRAFRQRLSLEERRSLSFYHLLVAYITLRWFNSRSSVVFCPSPPLPHPTLRPLLLLTLFSTLFDELIHLRILQLYIPHLHPSAACLIGTPAPPTSVDGDCCICFGTLIVPPSSSILSSSSYDDPTDRIDAETLDTFCHIPHHVAHRACMRRWVAAGRPWAAGGAGIVLGPGGMTILGGGRGEPTCPSCRGEIVGHMVVVEAKLRQEGGKGTEWRRWWAEVRRQIVWRDVGVRWVVTVAYVVVFWARGKWRDEGAWGWKGNARRTESWVVIGDVMR